MSKIVLIAIVSLNLMGAAYAAQMSAEVSGVVNESFLIKNEPLGIGGQPGIFCETDASVNTATLQMEDNYGLVSCIGDGATIWGPKGVYSHTFNVKFYNDNEFNLSVRIRGGWRGSYSGWPVLKSVNVPPKRVCSIQYSPRNEFTFRRGDTIPLRKILWGGAGKGSVLLVPHLSSNVDMMGYIAGDGGTIGYRLTSRDGSRQGWNWSASGWRGPLNSEYYLQFKEVNVPAGMYSGSLQVSLSCD